MLIQGKRSDDVTFVCDLKGKAREVYLAGDFNKWQPNANRMAKAMDGSFRAKVKLPPGRHEYKFVADGIWINDPDAPEQAPNPFGTVNSIVVIK
jgi:1,4-alpha-glucan branching enzyme